MPAEELSTLIALIMMSLSQSMLKAFAPLPGSLQVTIDIQKSYTVIMHTLSNREKKQSFRSSPPTLYEVLCRSYCRQTLAWEGGGLGVSDERDRIYGWFGLIGDDVESLGLEIDYRKQCYEVYADVTQRLILSGNLDILAFCQDRSQVANTISSLEEDPRRVNLQRLPSWAPNWSEPILLPSAWWKTSQTANLILGNGLFNASTCSKPDVYFVTHHDLSRYPAFSACFRGVHVDEVLETKSRYTRSQSMSATQNSYLYGSMFREIQGLCERSEQLDNKVYTIAQLQEASWRIPITEHEFCEGTDQIRRATTLSEQSYKQCLPLFESLESQIHVEHSDPEASVNTWRTVIQRAAVEVRVYLTTMASGPSAKPFISKKGYIGLGPGFIEPSDIICIFFGSRVPHILRKRQGRPGYVLIGQAYVYGLMDGKAMTDACHQGFEIF